MSIELKRWPASDLASILIGIAVLVAMQATVLSSIVTPSAVIAGSVAAVVWRHLYLCGYSMVGSTWRVRLMMLAAIASSTILGGSAALVLGFQ